MEFCSDTWKTGYNDVTSNIQLYVSYWQYDDYEVCFRYALCAKFTSFS